MVLDYFCVICCPGEPAVRRGAFEEGAESAAGGSKGAGGGGGSSSRGGAAETGLVQEPWRVHEGGSGGILARPRQNNFGLSQKHYCF